MDVRRIESCVIEIRARSGELKVPLVTMHQERPVDDVISADFTDGVLRIKVQTGAGPLTKDLKLLEVYRCLELGHQSISGS
jgi:hypothetical protein